GAVDYAWGQEGEGGPAIVVFGQVVEGRLIDHAGEIGRGGIDQGRFPADFHGLRGVADFQNRLDVGEETDLDCHVDGFEGVEAWSGDGDIIGRRLEMNDAEVAG